MEADLRTGIVAILKPDGTKAGTGFVVSDNGLIATCAHVAQIAGAEVGDAVDLIFHATGERRVARVDPKYWRDPTAQDVAILCLEGALPDEARPPLLGGTPEAYGHRFRTFGFPQIQEESGMFGYGTVGNLIDHAAAGPILQLSSTEVTSGFSGAPILDTRTNRVVGMVSEIAVPDQYGKQGETAFATPTKTLLTVCPALRLSEVCPYRRLDTFTEVDAEFFFGRQRAVGKLLKSLKGMPSLLAVLGPSGSGKSSLVQAGLIPELRKGEEVLNSEYWGMVITRRYDAPFEQLAAAGLVGAPEGLVEAAETWLSQHHEHGRLVLVLDQFEELLATHPEPSCREFVKQLTELLYSPHPVTIILTMQDIFYSHLALQAPKLTQEWLSSGLVQAPRDLEREDLVAIVRRPAETVGLRFEDGLIEEIVNDAMQTALEEGEDVAHSTVLPLLESALTELWKRRQDGMLTRNAYAHIGRLTGGLTQWADQALKDLGDLRPLARHVFTELVELGDKSKGIPIRRLRRPLAELSRSESEGEEVLQVVRRLANARLLVTTYDRPSRTEFVEIIHDTLLREWGLLGNWLIMGDTKEAILEPQERAAKEEYRKAVAEAWMDRKLSKAEAERLNNLANELGLSTDTAAEIERELMGGTIGAILERQTREAEERRKHLNALYAGARRLHRDQKWRAVVDEFDRIHELDPAYPDPEELLVAAQEAQVTWERSVASMYEQGLQHRDAGEWSRALRCFEEIQRQAPGYREIGTLLVQTKQRLGDGGWDTPPDGLPDEPPIGLPDGPPPGLPL